MSCAVEGRMWRRSWRRQRQRRWFFFFGGVRDKSRRVSLARTHTWRASKKLHCHLSPPPPPMLACTVIFDRLADITKGNCHFLTSRASLVWLPLSLPTFTTRLLARVTILPFLPIRKHISKQQQQQQQVWDWEEGEEKDGHYARAKQVKK